MAVLDVARKRKGASVARSALNQTRKPARGQRFENWNLSNILFSLDKIGQKFSVNIL
jgi:hypothetical protein